MLTNRGMGGRINFKTIKQLNSYIAMYTFDTITPNSMR